MNGWLKDNAWNIIVTAVAVTVAFVTLNTRLEAVEKKIAKYPSQDYFELKFGEIEKDIEKNSGLIEELHTQLIEHE